MTNVRANLAIYNRAQSYVVLANSLTTKNNSGGIVVRILHHVHQVHDGCIFVAMRLFGEKAAWVHQAHYVMSSLRDYRSYTL